MSAKTDEGNMTMGMTLEFLIGDEEKIVEAVSDLDFDMLDNCVTKRADFSLHIEPRDLNTLSEVAAKLNGKDAIRLRDFLDVVIDEPDFGLLCVNSQWVNYFASLNPTLSHDLSKAWFDAMQKQYPDEEIQLNEAASNAVNDLINLCIEAKENGQTAYHFWSL